MTEAEIHREESDTKGRYWIEMDGHVAEMTYSRADENTIIIDHTGVPDAFRGQGIAKKLVERGIADARAEGRKIVPLCSYVKAQFDRHPEWADLRA